MKFKNIMGLFANNRNKEFCGGIFFTYTFQPEFFETEILSLFYETSCNPSEDIQGFISEINTCIVEKPITVVMDDDNYIGGKALSYDLLLYKSRVFHPKLFILQFEDILRVIIGSANMTEQGICKNVELITHFDIDENRGGEYAEEILNLLTAVKIDTKGLGDAGENIINLLNKYIKPRKKNSPRILHTYMSKGILDNVFNEIEGEIKSVTVMSPFYEKDVVTDKSIDKTVFGKLASKNIKTFNLYMPATWQPESKKWKIEGPKNIIKGIQDNENIKLKLNVVENLWVDEKSKEQHRELHGKLLSIETTYGVYTLMGSPNFTQAALTSSKKSRKNIELGILFYSKKKPRILNYKAVKMKDIEFVEPVIIDRKKINIVEKAVMNLNNQELVINFSQEHENKKVEIYLKHELVYTGFAENQIILKLNKSEQLLCQEIKIIFDDEEYFYPLEIEGKEKIIELTEGVDFKLTLKELIDFYSGKYKNIKQIVKARRLIEEIYIENTRTSDTYDIETFRYDIRSFLKAIDALVEKINKTFWTEIAFTSMLNGPFGINRFIELLDEAIKNKVIENQELFFYYINIYDKLNKVQFNEGVGLDVDTKNKYRLEIMGNLEKRISSIVRRERKRNVKKQYEIVMEMYLN